MAERIVVGVVDTSAGRRALEWAAHRARSRKASLLLASVVGGAVGAVGEGPVVDAAIAAARSLLEEHAETLKAQGLDVDIVVLRGDPVRQLVSTTAGANLLVIGSDFRPDDADSPRRGAHGLRIVADSSCPVVVIPDIETSDRRGVVVGVDGSPISEAAVAFAAAEADRLGEPLVAVTVWTPVPLPRGARAYPEQYLSSMQELSEETLAVALGGLRSTYPDLEIQPRVERGYPSEIINRAAATASLAVVGSHGRGAVARFLLGSISHEVLAALVAPTAVVR
ncbi:MULTISPECIES: universal stress protein [unclassified Microbacterium]|uniref:universal stress protein n=1 Tax=unclassified Microbacterium TaxID=2609290 RepID=UPI000F89AEE5|nr:universal stress protein [Microbacterium sp. HSID17254]RUQ03166.1 universal stress protein [Microbacterium sp. HSID17254]